MIKDKPQFIKTPKELAEINKSKCKPGSEFGHSFQPDSLKRGGAQIYFI